LTVPQTTTSGRELNRKPRDDELDVYGLTHPGLIRRQNQDHFLICSLRKEVVVHLTSLQQLGGRQTAPVLTRLDQQWGNVGLLCSGGLTRHVSDERIRDRLRSMSSAKQVCEDLLQDALEGGGSDNITVLVGRTVERDLE
jgi:serine/threonine protein phosphatase PrpC